jgi:hypothetical protein
MNFLDIRKIGATGYQIVEYRPGLREDVHFASNSASDAVEFAREILRKRSTCVKPSQSLQFFLSEHEYLKIEIDLSNAAFGECATERENECRAILAGISDALYFESGNSISLFDSNGNKVGTAKVTR